MRRVYSAILVRRESRCPNLLLGVTFQTDSMRLQNKIGTFRFPCYQAQRNLTATHPLMAKNTLSFVCQNCGAAYNRWQGKCESCGEWNTLAEEDATGSTSMPVSIRSKRKGRLLALEPLTGKSVEAPRLPSGMAELDRVTGGGFVRGSVLLVGGDPGIGKSTLLTQATSLMARAGHRAVYISGEEAVAQGRLRAGRPGLARAPGPA